MKRKPMVETFKSSKDHKENARRAVEKYHGLLDLIKMQDECPNPDFDYRRDLSHRASILRARIRNGRFSDECEI